jgi:two-component system, cell cycle sensor histidine kinase and response regulator CckA
LNVYGRQKGGISFIILDLIMTQMGGNKCLEELLKINPNVRVIVSSGHAIDGQELQHVGRLAKGFVNKPYNMKGMLQAVREVWDT